MAFGLILGGLLGLGLWLMLSALLFPTPGPDLAVRLNRLSVQGRMAMDADAKRRGPALFKAPALERLLRPLLEDAGSAMSALYRRTGIGAPDLESRLARAWSGMTPAQFYGQKLSSGLVLLIIFPLMNVLGVQPFGPWPVWIWLAGFWFGFAMPDWMIESRIAQRRLAVLVELPAALDLMAIGSSAGMSPEQALVEASREVHGPLGEGLRHVVREASLGSVTHVQGLRDLAEQEGLTELASVADAWQSSLEQGLPLGHAMLTLAATVRERKRTRLLEEGGKSTVRMLFPVALFIFPVFLIVLLYPAGTELMGLGD